MASLLLIVNEAQDIEPAVYDRNFAPMAASTNATRLFMGTAWTSRTLLSRELRLARQAEQQDGIRRVFTYDADDVRQRRCRLTARTWTSRCARLGRGHPLIKTQYFNEEIDAQAGMFNAARRALMQCDEPTPSLPSPGLPFRTCGRPPSPFARCRIWERCRPRAAEPGGPYVFSIDVAGQDEATFHNPEEQLLRNPGRDSVALTIAIVDLSAHGDAASAHLPRRAPRTVDRASTI